MREFWKIENQLDNAFQNYNKHHILMYIHTFVYEIAKTVYSSLTNKNFLRECLCTVATDRALCCYNCCCVHCKMGPASPTSTVPMVSGLILKCQHLNSTQQPEL